MTREQAITTLVLHLMQCGTLMPIEWVDKNGEGSDTMLAFNMAMEALREQAERSKGCEWCKVGQDNARTVWIDGSFDAFTGDSYGEGASHKGIIDRKVAYCPMCEDCPDGCPVETPKDSRNIVTNADRIRKTTDEELAKMLAYNDVFYEEICGSDERTRVCDNDCVACTLEWLRQRAKEEHHENY